MEEVFVEDLHRDLERALEMIDEIAEKVQRKELDAFEGFMQSEEYKNKVVEIGYKLKELGIDITEMK